MYMVCMTQCIICNTWYAQYNGQYAACDLKKKIFFVVFFYQLPVFLCCFNVKVRIIWVPHEVQEFIIFSGWQVVDKLRSQRYKTLLSMVAWLPFNILTLQYNLRFVLLPLLQVLLLDTFTKSHYIYQAWTAFQKAVTQYVLSPFFTVIVRVCGAETVPWPRSSALWIFIWHCLEVRNSHYAVLDLLK